MGRAAPRNSFINQSSHHRISHKLHDVASRKLSEKSLANWLGETCDCFHNIVWLHPDLHQEVLYGENAINKTKRTNKRQLISSVAVRLYVGLLNGIPEISS